MGTIMVHTYWVSVRGINEMVGPKYPARGLAHGEHSIKHSRVVPFTKRKDDLQRGWGIKCDNRGRKPVCEREAI